MGKNGPEGLTAKYTKYAKESLEKQIVQELIFFDPKYIHAGFVAELFRVFGVFRGFNFLRYFQVLRLKVRRFNREICEIREKKNPKWEFLLELLICPGSVFSVWLYR